MNILGFHQNQFGRVLLNGLHNRAWILYLFLNSEIISCSPNIFEEFQEKQISKFCGGEVAMVSVLWNFTSDVTVTQTL
jgi:hypothetical protein